MSDTAVFKKLSEINVNHRVEKKNKLTYLSWAWAWAEASKAFPDISYEVIKFDGKPYLADSDLGYMIETSVTMGGKTLPMHLPVMDGANNAMKNIRYSYQVIEWKNRVKTGNFIDKWVEQASMFDINKTIMRCLVKNLAMFGLGLYIYAGEDLPDVAPEPANPDIQKAIDESDQKWVKDNWSGSIAADWAAGKLSNEQCDKLTILFNQQ